MLPLVIQHGGEAVAVSRWADGDVKVVNGQAILHPLQQQRPGVDAVNNTIVHSVIIQQVLQVGVIDGAEVVNVPTSHGTALADASDVCLRALRCSGNNPGQILYKWQLTHCQKEVGKVGGAIRAHRGANSLNEELTSKLHKHVAE